MVRLSVIVLVVMRKLRYIPVSFIHTVQDDIDRLLGVDQNIQQRSIVQFILKLKEAKQVSQSQRLYEPISTYRAEAMS